MTDDRISADMPGSRPSVETCIKWINLMGVTPHGQRHCDAIDDYLRELESLRAENERLREALNDEQVMGDMYKEAYANKRRDELLTMTKALIEAGYYTANDCSVVEHAKRLIAAVDAACGEGDGNE